MSYDQSRVIKQLYTRLEFLGFLGFSSVLGSHTACTHDHNFRGVCSDLYIITRTFFLLPCCRVACGTSRVTYCFFWNIPWVSGHQDWPPRDSEAQCPRLHWVIILRSGKMWIKQPQASSREPIHPDNTYAVTQMGVLATPLRWAQGMEGFPVGLHAHVAMDVRCGWLLSLARVQVNKLHPWL